MSLETLFDPQTAFISTEGPLLSPDTDFMNFVNPGSQNVSKALAAQVGPYRGSELCLTKKSVLSVEHCNYALEHWM